MSLMLILAILTLSVASPATVTGGYGNGMVNVATDYDLGMNESKEGNLKDWHIAKVKDGDMTRLDVRCIWIYDDNSYVTFYVYDSPQDAKKGYENIMELFEKYDAIMEVGDADSQYGLACRSQIATSTSLISARRVPSTSRASIWLGVAPIL